jgi:hypothetical protein
MALREPIAPPNSVSRDGLWRWNGQDWVGFVDSRQDKLGGSGYDTRRPSGPPLPALVVVIVLGVGLWSLLLGISYWLGGLAGVVLCVLGVVSLTTAALGWAVWRETRMTAIVRRKLKPDTNTSGPSVPKTGLPSPIDDNDFRREIY